MNRKKRYYERRVKNKGTCPDCSGPMSKYSKRCINCQRQINGERLGKLSILKAYE